MTVVTKPAWAIDANKQDALGAELKEIWLHLVDPDGWWDAKIRDSGCVDLHRYFNDPRGDDEDRDDADYLHICDVDDMIARLQQLKIRAQLHFGTGWK